MSATPCICWTSCLNALVNCGEIARMVHEPQPWALRAIADTESVREPWGVTHLMTLASSTPFSSSSAISAA